MYYCKLLPDLPKPPSHLIDQINMSLRAKFLNEPENVVIEKPEDWQEQSYKWIKPMPSNNNARAHFNAEFLKWIQVYITPNFTAENSGVMFFDEPQLPHCDTTRDFVLLYNLDTGGTTDLCFWKEDGQEIIRPRMTVAPRGPNLELLQKIEGPYEQWYLMNTRVLHSVENMTGVRVNLQVSLKDDSQFV